MPNMFAYLVLLCWPLVTVILFRRFSLPTALAWSLIAGYLLLPVSTSILKLPILPGFNKNLITSVSAAVMCYIVTRENDARMARAAGQGMARATAAVTRSNGVWIVNVLIALLLISPFLTVLFNTRAIVMPGLVLPGLGIRDALVTMAAKAFLILPFLLARRYLATPEAHVAILKALFFGALFYSLLILIEVRIAPQLNLWIYGFFPHSWAQHYRAGGFRPVVFLEHGLRVGIFLTIALLGTLVLVRVGANRLAYVIAAVWLSFILIISKNVGALAIAVAVAPLILLTGVRFQLVAAAVVAAVVLIYPAARSANLMPVDRIEAVVAAVKEDKTGSLKFRLDNEDILLERARLKPFVGWGGWNRQRVFDDQGRDISTTDGTWIIVIGTSGWIGYFAQFGLITIPVILLALRRRRLKLTLATSGLCLLLAANLIDLIPNSALTPITWLVAGALMGRYGLAEVSDAPVPDTAAAPVARASRYSRFPPKPGLVARS